MKFFQRLLATVFPTSQLHNSRTVRYAFSFLFLFAAVLGMAAVTTKNGSTVEIVANQTSVEIGTIFSVDVFVYASTPVNAVDLRVSFPGDQVEIMGIDRGDSVITLWTEDPRVEGNTVLLSGGTYKKGFVGKHKIATIQVKAKAAGQAKFLTDTVTLLAGDGKGSTVAADITNAVAETSIVTQGTAPSASAISGDVAVVIATDVDGDGTVSLRDISSFMAGWASKGTQYDFNNDGVMSFRDFSILLADYFTNK